LHAGKNCTIAVLNSAILILELH